MTRRATPLPHGWWIIPGLIICGAACFAAVSLMIQLTAWAQGWGAMP